ncbi:hypothetical protein ACQEWB_31985 [Streptomyces sp. CA-249302]|uniref:hypothetical protein n=1 Tax=Streptomyces sp. CA-249302 TaxID=3240058 RepID=UPI003D94B2D2
MTNRIPTAEELVAALPAFAGYLREAALLQPSAGVPGFGESSVGGPLLWPAGEPWPVCPGPHLVEVREQLSDEDRETWQRIDEAMRARHREHPERAYEVTAEEAETQRRIMDGAGALDLITWETMRMAPDASGPGVAMVPVVQLYARDMPGDDWHWPAGTDVLQVLWCPNDHDDLPGQSGYYGPAVELRYRRASDVTEVLVDPPHPDRTDDSYLPQPCVLDPVAVTDLPDRDELPGELAESGEDWAEERAVEYHRGLACREGWKLGGWPSWHLTDLLPIDCTSCDSTMRVLLTVDSCNDGPDVNVGRFGELRVFICPTDLSHPFQLNIQ